ncbi:hypothetical protein [Pandoraea sputorum]|uniref:hypothetical protein n=1 Tax=Pandoraea sputorum TaxID=93222 RepID=UPI0012FD3A8D
MSAPDYRALLSAALSFKRRYPLHTEGALRDRTIYFLFYNASLRTRSSFQTGLARLGGTPSSWIRTRGFTRRRFLTRRSPTRRSVWPTWRECCRPTVTR